MSQKRFSPLLFIFASFILFVTVQSQDKQEIKTTIANAFAQQINPGLTVTVVQNGETVFAEGFGVKDKISNEPVTNSTLFGIGYLTETFTTTLLEMVFKDTMYYYDKSLKNLGINSTSNWKLFPLSYLRSKYASSRDLAAHRMGFPKYKYLRFDDKLNRSNAMSRYEYLRPVGRFRDSFYFSVHDYSMLCVVLETIGNGTFETLMKDRLLNPLNMASTKFWTTDDLSSADLAKGYIDYYGTLYPVSTEFLKNLTKLGCADTIAMSGLDMGKWMKFIQAGGKTDDNVQRISRSDLEDMRKPWLRIQSPAIELKVPATPYTYSFDSYGVGWRRGYYRGHRISGQSGYIYGYTCHLTMFEDAELGIYTSMSGEDEDHTFQAGIHAYLADMYLNMTGWLNSTSLGNRLADFIPPQAKTAPTFDRTLSIAANRTASNYTGTYHNDLHGDVVIESDSNGKLKMIYGFVHFNLFPKATVDHFYFESLAPAEKVVNNAQLQFNFTANPTDLLIPTFESKDKYIPTFTKVL